MNMRSLLHKHLSCFLLLVYVLSLYICVHPLLVMTVIERMEDVDMDDNSSSVGRLEEEAKRRKERLQQMRKAAEGGSDAPSSSSSSSTVEGVHHLPA